MRHERVEPLALRLQDRRPPPLLAWSQRSQRSNPLLRSEREAQTGTCVQAGPTCVSTSNDSQNVKFYTIPSSEYVGAFRVDYDWGGHALPFHGLHM